jgi:crooked neck
MPRKVKKRRKLDDDSFEEYVDYVFPADDESAANLSRLLANAQRWKMAQAQAAQAAQGAEEENGDGE